MNAAPHNGSGGGIRITSSGNNGGWLESCTVASNTAYQYAGGLLFDNTNSFVSNCVIYGNTVTSGADKNDAYFYTAAATNAPAYCLFTAALSPAPGRGNITNRNALFVNAPAGDFRLAAGSPAIGAGTNLPWMDGALDLDRRPRLRGGTVDMGAYEFFPAGTILSVR